MANIRNTKEFKYYLNSMNDTLSYLNLINMRKYFTEDKLTDFYITDHYDKRIDRIAKDFYGNNRYWFFITVVANIQNEEDISTGKIIKIPKQDYIDRYIKELKIEKKG